MSALQQVRQQLQQARIQHEQEQPASPRTREEFDAYLAKWLHRPLTECQDKVSE